MENKFKKQAQTKNSFSAQKVKEIILMDKEWETMNTIDRKAQILASDMAMNIFGANDPTSLQEDTLQLIFKNQLPPAIGWDYWILINQRSDYWINRYDIKCEDPNILYLIKTCLRQAVIFGTGCILKEKENYLVGCLTGIKTDFNGVITNGDLLPSALINHYTGISNNGEVTKKEIIEKKTTIKDKKFAALQWRYNGIGDYVWTMKDLLIEIYMKRVIEVNSSNLLNKPLLEVKNIANLKTEIAIARNPFVPVNVIIKDPQSEESSNKYSVMDLAQDKSSHVNSLIEALKHHQEYYYAKYGIPISSNKQQSLSADASLSIQNSRCIAEEHDWRVKKWIEEINKEFSLKITCEIFEEEIQPENENADKEGKGISKTEGDINQEKAGNE